MFHELFLVGRFRIFPDYPSEIVLLPAKRAISPVVESTLSYRDLVCLLRDEIDDRAPLASLNELGLQGVSFVNGYLECDKRRINDKSRWLLNILVEEAGCMTTDCIGRISSLEIEIGST